MRSSILKMTVSNCFNGLIFKNIFKRAHDYTDCMLISHIEIVKSWLFILPRHLLQAYAIMNAPNLEMYRFCIIISSVTQSHGNLTECQYIRNFAQIFTSYLQKTEVNSFCL